MNTLHLSGPRFASLLSLACVILLGLGCSTSKVDWNSRVGSYTMDQAILDFGPPDKEAELSDSTKVLEWRTAKGYSHGSIGPVWGSRFYSGPWMYHYVDPPTPDHYLRLVFSQDGRLMSWRRIQK